MAPDIVVAVIGIVVALVIGIATIIMSWPEAEEAWQRRLSKRRRKARK